MPPQHTFSFDSVANYAPEDFMTSECNASAYALMAAWPEWSTHCAVLVGPAGSGKTHLAHVWRAHSGAVFLTEETIEDALQATLSQPVIIENIETFKDEALLFHLYNKTKEEGISLLLTSRQPVSELDVALNDLSSRLRAATEVEIKEPDDVLLEMLFAKYFADKQLKVSAEVIQYLLPRIGRSFESVREVVETIDARALAEKRNITVPLVNQVLKSLA
jgi:chromosomal replication initiation ATPase DnaA